MVRAVGKARKPRQHLGVRPVLPGVAQRRGMVGRRVVDIRDDGLRPAIVDQGIRLYGRPRSGEVA
jgi:hypothetical protein